MRSVVSVISQVASVVFLRTVTKPQNLTLLLGWVGGYQIQ